MPQFTFTVTPSTDFDTLRADVPELTPFYGALLDLIREIKPGVESETITAEVGDCPLYDAREQRQGEINVLFLPEFDRAAVEDNGAVRWTDAHSVEDAIARYLSDDLRN